MVASEWVPVSDRLPETKGLYLTYADSCVYAMSYYPATPDGPAEWCCAQGDGWNIPTSYVTHWMPMPQPPSP